MIVYVLMGYDNHEGGVLHGVYSTQERADEMRPFAVNHDDVIVHAVRLDAAPASRSPVTEPQVSEAVLNTFIPGRRSDA